VETESSVRRLVVMVGANGAVIVVAALAKLGGLV